MMIDIHTHLWPSDKTSQALKEYFAARGMDPAKVLSAEGLLESMQAGIDLSVVSALGLYTGATNGELSRMNDFVAGEVKKSQGKLIGFCTVDPFGGKESVRFLQKYIEEDGFKGLKLHQNIQGFYPDDERLYPIYEKMQMYGLPVLYHTGGIGIKPFLDKYSELIHIEEVACKFPEMPIILGHAGRGKYDDVALLLRKHANVYADVSANFAKLAGSEQIPMQDLICKVKIWVGNTDKLLFGSDYPFYGQGQTIELLSKSAATKDELHRLAGRKEADEIGKTNAYTFCKKYGLLK